MAVGFVGVIFMALALLVCTFLIGLTPLYLFQKATNGGDRYLDLSLSDPSGDDGVVVAATVPDMARQEGYIALLSYFGVGMLLGTSFMLVIPEGIKECIKHDGNVGLNLLIGFLAVYLLDRFVQILIGDNADGESPSLDENRIRFNSLKDLLRNPREMVVGVIKNNVVFALFVHGLSDGIALGTTVQNSSLLFVMLIAIVIHKIPAVLSLTSLMISKQKLPKWEVISNLFAFSASTPIGYVCLSIFNLKHSETMNWLSGNLLLMSGGSLLFASFTAFGGHAHTHGTSGAEDKVNLPNGQQTGGTLDSSGSKATPSEIGSPEWGPRNYNLVDEEMMQSSGLTGNLDEADNVTSARLKYNSKWWTRVLDPDNPLDDSVYILAGVMVPTIISFIIGED